MAEPAAVAVLVRSSGPRGLEGLRTALSLSLGDRPPALYLLGPGRDLLDSPPESEAGRSLATLIDEVGVTVRVETGGAALRWDVGHGTRGNLLREAAVAPFEQVF